MPASPAEVFQREGLGAPGWLRAHAQAALFSTRETAARLVGALRELGGVYRAFGQFLRWRADVLEPEYRDALRQADFSREPLTRSAATTILRRDLGAAADELEKTLEPAVLWSTFSRTAWKAQWKGAPVVVQVAREKTAEAELKAFERGIKHLRHGDLKKALTPQTMRQFRDWIQAGEGTARERAYLDVLNRNQEAMLAGYPELIPGACGGQVLVWKWVEAEPVSERVKRGDREAVIAAASAVLEQFCSLSVVEADLDPGAMVIDAAGRLHFRRIGCPIAVPPAMVNGGMKYIAAVLTGSDSLSAEQLAFLAAGAFRNETARELVDAFSSVEPELKIRLWFPASASIMENNWRALELLKIPRLLYLDCMQRNLSALGYWNADAVTAGAPRFDAIAEAQWAVVGRMMRAQAGELADPKTALEWVMGAGILMFGSARELNRMAEEIRENNLTLGVDIAPAKTDASQTTRNWQSGILLAILLTALLWAIRWGPQLHGGWRNVTAILAAGAMAAMFWLVTRLG